MEKKLSYKAPSLRLLALSEEENFLVSAVGGIDVWTEDPDEVTF